MRHDLRLLYAYLSDTSKKTLHKRCERLEIADTAIWELLDTIGDLAMETDEEAIFRFRNL